MNALVVALFATMAPYPHDVPTPWRMGDWATCRDGTQSYSRNAQYPTDPPADRPCARNGGVRAFGPGKRLNER
jgi:hypothetical protein